MHHASRIFSILLGIAMTFLLWPVTVPLGFGEVWWASRKAQSQSDAKPVPRPRHRSRSPQRSPLCASAASRGSPPPPGPLPRRDATAVEPRCRHLPIRLIRRKPTPRPRRTAAGLRRKRTRRRRCSATETKLYYRVTSRRRHAAIRRCRHQACRYRRARRQGKLQRRERQIMALRRGRQIGPHAIDPLPRRHLRAAEGRSRRTSPPAARWPAPISPPGWCARAGPSRKTLTRPRSPKRRQPPNRTRSGSGAARSKRSLNHSPQSG